MFNKLKKWQWRFLPVILLFAVLPLIVRLVHFNLDPTNARIYLSETLKDWFFYYKSVFFILLTVWMLICLVFLRKKIQLHRDFWFNTYYLLGGIFIITSLLSALLSDYRTCATVGAPTRFEGIGVLVCYILVMFYTFFVFEESRSFKYIFYSLMVLVAIQLIFGISQFVGYDLLNLRGLRELVSPGELAEHYYFSTGSEPLFMLTTPGAWTGTLGNKNYSGSFVALVLPLFATLTCLCKAKSTRLLMYLTTLASIFIMFACNSQAGQVGIAGCLVVALIVFGRSFPTYYKAFKTSPLKKRVQQTSLLVFTGCYIVFAMYITGGNREINAMFQSIATSLGIIEKESTVQTPKVTAFDFDTNRITVSTEEHKLNIEATQDTLVFTDEMGQPVATTLLEDGTYHLQDERFYNYGFLPFSTDGETCISFLTGSPEHLSTKCLFYVDTTGHIELLNPRTLEPVTIENPPTLGFEGRERLGSSRGFIWSRTLPLLKDYMLLGAGPDAFIYVYPQNDFFGKWHHMSDPFIVVDKPHNTYLQLWINQGFIALLAFLLINAFYLFHCMRLYAFKKVYSIQEGIGLAFMLAIVAYLGTSLFNDTTLSVTPLYFALLGCGMAYNRIYTRTQGPHQ